MEAHRKGNSKAKVNEMFGLGVNTLRDWEILEAETGSLENRTLDRKPHKIDREKLLAYYKNNSDSTKLKEYYILLSKGQ